MQFNELEIDALFTFHSFSNEIWQKVNATQCLCISYENEEVDEPHTLTQRVFQYVPKVEKKQTDKFQPMALILALRRYIQEVRENEKLEPVQKEHIALGLAWAISEIEQQATAKDRYTV